MSLATNIQSVIARIATEFKTLRTFISGSPIGNVSGLNTVATNLVSAINENSALSNSALQPLDVINTLTSSIVDKPLSALQGQVLNSKILAIQNLLNSDDLTLDELQEIVDFIKQNKTELESLGIANIAGLQSALDNKVVKIGALSQTISGDLTVNNIIGDGSNLTGVASSTQGVLADNSVQKTGQTTQTVNGTLIASTMRGGIDNDYTSVSFLGIEMSRVESYIRPVTDLGGRLFIGKELRRFTNIDIYSNGVFSINENVIWHAGNDGVGSDLDAGLLGGQLPAFYAADSNVVKKTGETSQSIDGNLRTGSIYINEGNVALGDGLLLENVAGKLNWDGGQLVNSKYIASRGENLITNYSGLLGTNYNFSSFTFDGVEANSSPGSFRHTSASTEVISTDEFMAINASNRYRMSVDAKSLNGVGRYYMMTMAYDVDGIIISAIHHMYKANTATTLAVALNPGDTTVTLASNGANYNNTGTANVSPHLRSLIFWEYTNSLGYTYPVETYSRLYYPNQWDPGSISGNVITLRTPWAGPAYPVGSKLSNGNSGNSYKYNVLSNNTLTTNWVTYTGYMDGVDYSGTNVTNKFSPGTASIRMGWLMNFQGNASETIWFTNLFVGKDTRATDISSGVFNIDRIPTGTGGAVLDSDSRLSDIRIDPSKLPLTGGTLTGALRLKSSWSTSFLQSNSVYAESGINGFAFGLGTGVSSWFSKGGSTVNRAIDVWNDNSKIVLGSSGANVGIKNTNPTETLDVTGNVKATSFIATNKIESNVITSQASAQLQVDSTTRGSLVFPRMTNAQRTAITSPAIGLHVYCTDATDGVYVYKTSGWTFAY